MFVRKVMNRTCALAHLLTVVVFGLMVASAAVAIENWPEAPCEDASGPIIVRVVMVEDESGDPRAAGQAAARQLLAAMGDVPLKAVVISECFEDWEYKEPMLQGVCSVIPPELVFGGATYGSFTHDGCTDLDAVSLMGVGGSGIGVSAALVTDLGVSRLTFEDHEEQIRDLLRTSGRKLADRLPKSDQDRLAVLIADAHSPKNQYLVEGLQRVLGQQFPITGGSVNKNAGQTYVYFQGKAYQDSALALMLSGSFHVSLTGRKAMDNDAVIATARDAAGEALAGSRGTPLAVFAFNCAGRRGKLDDPAEELAAIQEVLNDQLPLFGCYCAGEVGPLDLSERVSDTLSGGVGWHVMFTVLAR